MLVWIEEWRAGKTCGGLDKGVESRADMWWLVYIEEWRSGKTCGG